MEPFLFQAHVARKHSANVGTLTFGLPILVMTVNVISGACRSVRFQNIKALHGCAGTAEH